MSGCTASKTALAGSNERGIAMALREMHEVTSPAAKQDVIHRL